MICGQHEAAIGLILLSMQISMDTVQNLSIFGY